MESNYTTRESAVCVTTIRTVRQVVRPWPCIHITCSTPPSGAAAGRLPLPPTLSANQVNYLKQSAKWSTQHSRFKDINLRTPSLSEWLSERESERLQFWWGEGLLWGDCNKYNNLTPQTLHQIIMLSKNRQRNGVITDNYLFKQHWIWFWLIVVWR